MDRNFEEKYGAVALSWAGLVSISDNAIEVFNPAGEHEVFAPGGVICARRHKIIATAEGETIHKTLSIEVRCGQVGNILTHDGQRQIWELRGIESALSEGDYIPQSEKYIGLVCYFGLPNEQIQTQEAYGNA